MKDLEASIKEKSHLFSNLAILSVYSYTPVTSVDEAITSELRKESESPRIRRASPIQL